MNTLFWIMGLALSYFLLCWAARIRSEKRMLDLKFRGEYMQYVISVKEEIRARFSVSWTLFYEAYLFVYSNQNMIPNDKELDKYREMFKGYFKLKLTKSELERYMDIFDDDVLKLDEFVDYMFMQKCQSTFINPTLDAIAEASSRRKGIK